MLASLASLPITPKLPEILTSLRKGNVALAAETGAGKTTALPAALLEAQAFEGRLLVLEPRRLAAVSAAWRCAELLGEAPGRSVGWRVRGDVKTGPATRVEYLTEAVFLRMIQEDPLLEGVGLVAFDEFHERSLVADAALAFCLEAQDAGAPFKLMLMSASLDTQAAAAFIGGSLLELPGRAYPVTVSYQPPQPAEAPEEVCLRAAASLWPRIRGDILVFLPGLRELKAAAALTARALPDAEAVLLHGSLPLEEQRRAITPAAGGPRRLVLATSVAETSLTVPGIEAVVDSGLARLTKLHHRSGMNRLVTQRVSQAEAEQRKGRAGRLGPGICVRCWDQRDLLEPGRQPEILRSELAGLVLECSLRGAAGPEAFRWLDAPPPHAWQAGASLLSQLGLTGPDGRISPRGRQALGLGTEPRAAAALLAARNSGRPGLDHLACLSVAILSERDAPDQADDSGLESRIDAVLSGRLGRMPERSGAILAEADRLSRRLSGRPFDPDAARPLADLAGVALAPGFPDRLARRQAGGQAGGAWELPSGRLLAHRQGLPESGWLVALDCDAGQAQGRIYRAAPVPEDAALAALEPLVSESVEFYWRGDRPRAVERLRAGALVLKERPRTAPAPAALAAAIAERLGKEGLGWLPWADGSRGFVDRARYALRLGVFAGVAEEAFSDQALCQALGSLLAPWFTADGLGQDGLLACLSDALSAAAGPDAPRILDRQAPGSLVSPGGRRRAILYPGQGEARLALRIQEAFGMDSTPLVCGRPLVLELLSPAERPLQVTKDLASFWATTYPDLRGQLQSRYPKHYWPENPLRAEPTKGLKPRP